MILKGTGKTSDRAFTADLIERSEGIEIYADDEKYLVDVDYYIKHQVIPVAHRVLQLFGYGLSSFDEGEQKTLAGYDKSAFDDGEQKTLTHWF